MTTIIGIGAGIVLRVVVSKQFSHQCSTLALTMTMEWKGRRGKQMREARRNLQRRGSTARTCSGPRTLGLHVCATFVANLPSCILFDSSAC